MFGKLRRGFITGIEIAIVVAIAAALTAGVAMIRKPVKTNSRASSENNLVQCSRCSNTTAGQLVSWTEMRVLNDGADTTNPFGLCSAKDERFIVGGFASITRDNSYQGICCVDNSSCSNNQVCNPGSSFQDPNYHRCYAPAVPTIPPAQCSGNEVKYYCGRSTNGVAAEWQCSNGQWQFTGKRITCVDCSTESDFACNPADNTGPCRNTLTSLGNDRFAECRVVDGNPTPPPIPTNPPPAPVVSAGGYTNLCGGGTSGTCNVGCNSSTGICTGNGNNVVKWVCNGSQIECGNPPRGAAPKSESWGSRQDVKDVSCGETAQVDVFRKNCRVDGGWSCDSSDLLDYMVYYGGACTGIPPVSTPVIPGQPTSTPIIFTSPRPSATSTPVPVCIPDQTRCSDNQVQVCNAGQTGYVLRHDCDNTNQICDEGRSDSIYDSRCITPPTSIPRPTTPPFCNPGDQYCSYGNVSTCKSDGTAYEDTQLCTNGCSYSIANKTAWCNTPSPTPYCSGTMICNDPTYPPCHFCSNAVEVCISEGGAHCGIRPTPTLNPALYDCSVLNSGSETNPFWCSALGTDRNKSCVSVPQDYPRGCNVAGARYCCKSNPTPMSTSTPTVPTLPPSILAGACFEAKNDDGGYDQILCCGHDAAGKCTSYINCTVNDYSCGETGGQNACYRDALFLGLFPYVEKATCADNSSLISISPLVPKVLPTNTPTPTTVTTCTPNAFIRCYTDNIGDHAERYTPQCNTISALCPWGCNPDSGCNEYQLPVEPTDTPRPAVESYECNTNDTILLKCLTVDNDKACTDWEDPCRGCNVSRASGTCLPSNDPTPTPGLSATCQSVDYDSPIGTITNSDCDTFKGFFNSANSNLRSEADINGDGSVNNSDKNMFNNRYKTCRPTSNNCI